MEKRKEKKKIDVKKLKKDTITNENIELLTTTKRTTRTATAKLIDVYCY